MLRILTKNRDFVIVYKPPGMPSQSDTNGDPDAISVTSQMLGELGEKAKLWLVHRLDRTVGGLLVFARNASAAAEISALVSNGGMDKHYLAVTTGKPEGGKYSDYLFKDSRLSKAYVVTRQRQGVKLAELECDPIAVRGEVSLSGIRLITGRFHQIRAQLSHRGTPIVGDGKYGSRDKGARMPALHAYMIGFEYRGKYISERCLPDLESYPWSLFRDEIMKEVNGGD